MVARKLFSLVTPAERRRWLALGPLLVLTGVVEMAGTGLVFLLVKVAGEPAAAAHMPLWGRVLAALGIASDRGMVLATGAAVALFFVLRSLVLLAVARAQSRVVADTIAGVSTRIFAGYLAAPYPVHLRHTSSELAVDTTVAVERAVDSGLGASAQLFAETVVSLGLLAILMVTAPLVTLATAAALALFVATTLRLMKRNSTRWGRARETLGRQNLKDAQEALGGIREIKILGREEAFRTTFVQAQEALARARGHHGWLINLPRIAIESIFVACVVLVIALATLGGKPARELVPLLGLFAYAGFRLIPAANRFLLHVDAVRGAASAIDRLRAHVEEFRAETVAAPAGEGAAMHFQSLLQLEGVSFRYGDDQPLVLRDVSVSIRRGESIGVVGPTGSGKSTLIDVLFGLLQPTSGRVTVDGADIRGARGAWQRRIGYVPQAPFLFADTIRRNIALGIAPDQVDEQRLREAVQLAQLAEFVDSLPQGVDTRVGERGIRLSGGQRQRVAIARALYNDPDLLVLDEATAALDNKTERDVTSSIEQLRGRKTLIVIAHRLSTVERCDALIFLSAGKVEAMAPFAQLMRESAAFRAMANAGPAELS